MNARQSWLGSMVRGFQMVGLAVLLWEPMSGLQDLGTLGGVKNPAASGGAFKDYSNRLNCESPAFSVR
jgi:hypothetical protein